ncbi:827b854a-e723-491e-981c-d37070a18270-CDS [Sclerotinia trifoliorum]|uniref:827b854a-e723-491e-981c-d37070a18270-CDS n=1 Tax=Sclerotinia trifoliorum TaxID=28548 RepID=A0A8H2W4R0_9HELO|nr:827b854a-e723-491e-981c-d37070a18270-CDS [Sclerotinia trifoliorum]
MSRALDQDAKASINARDSQKVYNDIAEIFTSHTSSYTFNHKLLDFELLGKGQLPEDISTLVLDNSVGIPKTKLIQAFVVARQLFSKFKDRGPEQSQEIRDATSIILLTDPEHLTACNARKRLIQNIQNPSPNEVEKALERELYFVDSLLTSHLNRHTKSPTLWSHRRWLLEFRQSMHLSLDVPQGLESIVMVAAERHPRNYYAWSHMRWLMISVEGGIQTFTYLAIIENVKKWCLKHPGDTSGWSFLLFCLSSPTFMNMPGWVVQKSLICEEVLEMAISLRWKEESLWVFLRTLVASGDITEKLRSAFLTTLEDLKNSLGDPRGRRIVQSAHEWYLDYEQKIQSTH